MATVPLLPPEIAQAVKTFWEAANGSPAFNKAKTQVAQYCVKNGVELARVLLKNPATVRAVGEVLKDTALVVRAVETADGLAVAAGAGGAVAPEAIAATALGEAAGISAGVICFWVVLFVVVVAVVAYSVYDMNKLNKMGEAQDRQRRLDKGLRSVIWVPPVLPAGRMG